MLPRLQISLLILLFSALNLSAQLELSGYISNADNGQFISEASIQVKDHSSLFCLTDSVGYFSISVPEAQGILVVRHVSYELRMYDFDLGSSQPLAIELIPSEQGINEVIIASAKNNARDNELREISFRKADINQMSSGFGEADVIRSLQSMPGIQKSSEVNAALNVRGTGHGNNRITFDGQDLHNSYHLMGIAPMFNPDILESVVLQKSGFNAQNGNALSSFLRVESRIPDLYDQHFMTSLCNLSTKAQYEGPIVKGKVSILAAARYSFFDMVSGVYGKLHEKKVNYNPLPEYHLYELFLKLHFELKKDWKADVTAFHTSDKFQFKKGNLKLRTNWKNQLYSFNLGKTLSPSSRITIHSGISVYNFKGDYNPSWNISRLNDLESWDSQINYNGRSASGLTWDAGAFSSLRYYYIQSEEKVDSQILREAETTEYSWMSGAYGNLRIPLTRAVELVGGLRFSHYYHDENLFRLAPRFQVNARSGDFAMNLSYDRTYQFAHLISPLGFNIPADLWVPSGANSPPQRCDQYALNFHYNFGILKAEMGVFYKDMEGLSDLKTGTEMVSFLPADVLAYGKGSAYGFETGWHLKLSFLEADFYYTYAHSTRTFQEINEGSPFSPPYDLPHQVDVNLKGDINTSWAWNLSWYRASGSVTTMPTSYVFLTHGSEALPYPIYTERYNFRIPASHRMDVSLMHKRVYPWGNSLLSFGIYNVYGNNNPFFLYFTIDELPDENLAVTPRMMSVFPFTPFICLKIQW
jgi:TonB-dependent receptor-like protein